MGKRVVVEGAQLMCTYGAAPSVLAVTSAGTWTIGDARVATPDDRAAIVNVRPFALCSSPSNPQVSAAQGAPQPCTPVVAAPWFPASAVVSLGGRRALLEDARCTCQWAGRISVTSPGQTLVEVDG